MAFTILSSNLDSSIHSFAPKAGHIGDYITIYGENFGNSLGEVYFGDVLAELSFPDECLNEVWQDDQVIVKVPKAIADGYYVLTLITSAGLETTSGDYEFYVGDYCINDYIKCGSSGYCDADSAECVKSARPGLCKIQPDNGSYATPVFFYGENFGATTGKAKFNVASGNVEVVPAQWIMGGGDNADKAEANVPSNPLSGKINIINAIGLESNKIQFDVKNCIDAGVGACPGAVCCGEGSYYSGSCMDTAIECGAGLNDPTDYIWTFTTASLSESEECDKLSDQISCEAEFDETECCWELADSECRVNGLCSGQNAPYVIEECDQRLATNCAENAGAPSPSPWQAHNAGKACIDSKIMAKFSENMDINSFNNGIEINKCETCDDCPFNEDMCGASIAGIFLYENTNFEFNPNENLVANSWYQVVLDGDLIQSEIGVNLDGDGDEEPRGDYTWTFKTRQDAAICSVDCPVVAPGKYTSNIKDEKISYIGSFSPKENKCSLLKDRGEEWAWSSDDSDKAEIVNDVLCNCEPENNCGCVNAKNETEATPVKIAGAYAGKSDFGLLSINFSDFKVIDYGPNCEYSCLNAQVLAEFNSEIDASTVTANNISLNRCSDDDCGTYSSISSGGTLNTDTITFNSPASLNVDTSYRAVIIGGEDGLRNVDGGTLSALNYSSFDKNKVSNYSFETNFGWDLNGMNRVTDKVRTGDYSLMAVNQNTAARSFPFNVMAGRKYSFSSWIYNSLEQGNAYIELSGFPCNREAVSKNWNNAWEKVECEFIAAETEVLRIYLNVENGQPVSPSQGGGHVWFDDIEFREVGGVKDSFSWVFKTSDELCEVNRVEVKPLNGAVSEIGESLLYRAIPYATSDRCSADGQELNGFSYDWTWTENPSVSWASISNYPICGNGIVEKGEECDFSSYGCNVNCLHSGSANCVSVDDIYCCGNNKIELGEECDGQDWCNAICLNEGSNTLYGSSCGNGILEYGEDCDEGDDLAGDGCDNNCLNEGTSNSSSGISPYQLVTADDGPPVGEFTATVGIQASAETKTGEGDFTIVCGYEYGGMQDHKCNNVGSNEKGVALNGCCGTRPTVIEPMANFNDFCLNGTVEVVFDQIMDESHLKNAEILERYNESCDCETSFWNGTNCQLLAVGAGKAVAGASKDKFQSSNVKCQNSNVKEAHLSSGVFDRATALSPLNMMDNIIRFFTDIFIGNSFLSLSQNTYSIFTESAVSYLHKGGQKSFSLFNEAQAQGVANWCKISQTIIPSITTRIVDGEERKVTKITIIPDDFLWSNFQYRLNFDGVRNKYGITIADSNIINITTGSVICEIDHVDITINPTSPVKTTSYDMFNCAGRNDCSDDVSGNPGCQHSYMAVARDEIGRSLIADYSWEELDQAGAIEMGSVFGQNNLITSNPLEDADANIKVTATGYGSAESDVAIKVFMCEHPWPRLNDYPFIDPVYNFSVYYCRDIGKENDLTDDLPGMGNIDPICNGATCREGVLREYLWVESAGQFVLVPCSNPINGDGICPPNCSVIHDSDCGCVNNNGFCGINCTSSNDNDCMASCGDRDCASGENCLNCSADCGKCPAICGDDYCDLSCGECAICPADCAGYSGCP
ncbi:Ig-like domain-containing protein [Patescibacteria group bacterium]